MVQNTIWPFPSNAPAVLAHGLHALRADDRPAVPLVRHAQAPGPGGRAGGEDRALRARRRPARRRRRASSGPTTTSTSTSGPRRSCARTASSPTTSSTIAQAPLRDRRRPASRTCSGPRWSSPSSTASWSRSARSWPRPGPSWPGSSTSAPRPTCGRCPRCRSRTSPPRSSGSTGSPPPPVPSSRAAWPPSPATSARSSWRKKRYYPNVTARPRLQA